MYGKCFLLLDCNDLEIRLSSALWGGRGINFLNTRKRMPLEKLGKTTKKKVWLSSWKLLLCYSIYYNKSREFIKDETFCYNFGFSSPPMLKVLSEVWDSPWKKTFFPKSEEKIKLKQQNAFVIFSNGFRCDNNNPWSIYCSWVYQTFKLCRRQSSF